MIKTIPILSCILLIAFGSIFSAIAQTAPGSKQWQQSWAKVKEGMWMQKTEVTNAEFKAFLEDVKANGNLDGYYSYYPDTLGWRSADAGLAPYESIYFSNPAFDNYPVANITREAAEAYSHWLASKYDKLDKSPFGKVAFRLPTRDEWMLAARSGKNDSRSYPWNGMYLKNNRGERLCNYLPDTGDIAAKDAGERAGDGTQTNTKQSITAPVNSFFPNDIGLYNTSGNVAEMVAEKGVAVGGSFRDPGYGVRIESKKEFESSAPDIGFRVMMVIIAK